MPARNIKSSTSINEQLGDRHWTELLREHDTLRRMHVQAHNATRMPTKQSNSAPAGLLKELTDSGGDIEFDVGTGFAAKA